MKLDERAQSIRALKPSNRDFATYDLPRGHAASLWAAPNSPGKTSYIWLELDHEEVGEVSYRLFATRAKSPPEEWTPMKPDGHGESHPFAPPISTFKATVKLAAGRYVVQARFAFGKRMIELPGVTFKVE